MRQTLLIIGGNCKVLHDWIRVLMLPRLSLLKLLLSVSTLFLLSACKQDIYKANYVTIANPPPEIVWYPSPIRIIDSSTPEVEIAELSSEGFEVLGRSTFDSNRDKSNEITSFAKEIDASHVIKSIKKQDELSSKYIHDIYYLALSKDKLTRITEERKRKAKEEDARPKLISEYKEMGYIFSDPMTLTEAKNDQINRLKSHMILRDKTEQDIKDFLKSSKSRLENSWDEYSKKMHPGDKISFVRVWQKSKRQNAVGTGWDGYVIIRNDHFLHSMVSTVYN